ncbi:gamma-glutamyltranspeptidase [Mesorhizobium abyssinicae]
MPIALNGSGRSPAKATIDWYRDRGMAAMPIYGPHSVTVPGAIDAWCRLQQDYGKLGLAEVLAPAIYYAEKGYVVHDRISFDWAASVSLLAADPHSAEIFLPGGQAPLAGDTHRQPALARTLQKIASEGRDGFYVGSVAEAIVHRLKELGGLHTLEDFSAAAGDYVTPISADYRGFRVHQVPPNNQGLTALLMLNILSGYCLTISSRTEQTGSIWRLRPAVSPFETVTFDWGMPRAVGKAQLGCCLLSTLIACVRE